MLVVALALVFVGIGFVEYATKTLLLNPKLIAENNVHTYFAINSVFFDPDIFGRFLALVMILLAAVLLYDRRQRDQLIAAAALAVLWGGLVLTLSRSSLGALLVGLGDPRGDALAGAADADRDRRGPRDRNRRRRDLAQDVRAEPGAQRRLQRARRTGQRWRCSCSATGRCGATAQGRSRPSTSGSIRATSKSLSASHTIAITIAAEQGLIGELPYIALW